MRRITDHLKDIVENSVKAGAKNISLEFIEKNSKHMLKFIVTDDGKGMNKETLKKVFDPFFTTRDHKVRKVGIGLSLLKRNCELTGGYVKIESKQGNGTRVEALFKTDSIDMPEIGNVPQTFLSIAISTDNVDFFMKREYNNKVYTISTRELRDFLGVSLSEPLIYKDLLDFFEKKEREITLNA